VALSALILEFSDLRKRSHADARVTVEPQEERKTMTVPQQRPRRRKPLDAGLLAATLFAHESAAFGVDVLACLGGDLC
jgi:hypothetical protein